MDTVKAKATSTKEPIENAKERYAAAKRAIEEQGIFIRHLRPQARHSVQVPMAIVEAAMLLGAEELPFDADGDDVVELERIATLQHGGMTLAYRQRREDSFIEVSSALCSLKDVFSRKVGTTVAVEEFMAGRVLRIPNYAGVTPTELVDYIFGDFLVLDSEG